ncbi:GSCFA domain-containing protein [Flavobacterium pedocola]
MNFRTVIPIPKTELPIDYDSKILSLGSCFAENMGEKFNYYKFQNSVNPFGIIFNPVSLEKVIRRAINQDFFKESDIFFHNERWNCFEVHSERSHSDKAIFLHELNQIVESTNRWIHEASHVIITLGTAWVYKNLTDAEIVANCHKVPQKQFTKELLSVEVIEESLQNILSMITSVNQQAAFIFTVSPVRHIKDGFTENQLSKSHLITALHKTLQRESGSQNMVYFPSYEIMMDELRDYRFYAEDMLHPNTIAVDYIWGRFRETMIAEVSSPVMHEVEAIQKGMQHRPFNPDSLEFRKFQDNLKERITRIQAQNPTILF